MAHYLAVMGRFYEFGGNLFKVVFNKLMDVEIAEKQEICPEVIVDWSWGEMVKNNWHFALYTWTKKHGATSSQYLSHLQYVANKALVSVQFRLLLVSLLLRNLTTGHEWSSSSISAYLRRGPRGCFQSEYCIGGEFMTAPRVNCSLAPSH